MKYNLNYFYIIVIGLFCTFSVYNKITYNWDFIGYMGVVVGYSEKSDEAIHKATYTILEKSLDVKKYELNADGYRKVMSEDYKAYAENLSYYKIRPLYTGLVYVFYKLGFPLIISIKILTAFSIFCILLVIYLCLKKEFKNSFLAFLFVVFLIYSPLILKIATTTPDALSSFLLFLLSISYYYQKRKLAQYVLMLLLIATRTDNILWVFLLLIFDSAHNYNSKKMLLNLLIMFSLFVLYNGINFIAGNSGLWIVYYNTLVNRLDYPLSQTPDFNLKDYFFGQIFALKYTIFTLCVTVVIAILGYLNFKNNKTSNTLVYSSNIILATVFSLIFRLFLFPAYNSRYMLILFFIPIYILIIENKKSIFKLLDSIHLEKILRTK